MLLPLSLLLLFSSGLRFSWQLWVDGQQLPGLFSSAQLQACRRAADRAAEEISRYGCEEPEIRKRCRISLGRAEGNERLLSEALLLCRSEAELQHGVYANGTLLGTVESGGVLCDEIRAYILNQMPNRAVFGAISGQVEIRPVYSLKGHETNYSDMVLLVTGMAPVFYVDSDGKLA